MIKTVFDKNKMDKTNIFNIMMTTTDVDKWMNEWMIKWEFNNHFNFYWNHQCQSQWN